jgi:predicted MPP superfamily phosphohydrolase
VIATWSLAWWVLLGLSIAPVVPGRWLSVGAAALVLVFIPLLFLGRAISGHYPSAAVRLLAFRPFWYSQLAVPLLATTGLVGLVLGALAGHARAGGVAGVSLAGVVVGLGIVTGYFGSRWLRVVRVEVRSSELPPALEGLRIAQVSDLHVGPHTPAGHLSRVLEAVRDAHPDLIAVTGDQVDDYAGDVEHFTRAFGELRAPLGVFAIAGNHDVYAGWPGVRAGLEAMGAVVLVNEARVIEHRGGRFWLAGTGDPAGHGNPFGESGAVAPDVARTLARVPSGAFTIALAHNPALWPALAARGVQLTLSGHTHHGQFSIPRLGWSLASVFLEHAHGWHRQGRALLYINPGTNYWGLPLRIGALPEVTILTLRRAGLGDEGIAPDSAPAR